MRSAAPLDAAPTTIKVLLADDRLVVREGLKRIVGEAPDMKVVGEAATEEEVRETVRGTDPDVVLLDVFLGAPKLLSLVHELSRRPSRCRVVVLSVQGQDPEALRLLEAGAAGYLSRDHSRRQLIEAIRQVAHGGSYVSPSLASTLISGLRGRGTKVRHDLLSTREYQVLCLFGSGVSFKQIATELGVSPKTVSTYRSRILDKLRLKSNAAIIRYAIEHDLVPPSATASPRRRKSTTHRSVGL